MIKFTFSDFINGHLGVEINKVLDLERFLLLCDELNLNYDINFLYYRKNILENYKYLFCYVWAKKEVFDFSERLELGARVVYICEFSELLKLYHEEYENAVRVSINDHKNT